jgi:DNA-binding protein HU-beta
MMTKSQVVAHLAEKVGIPKKTVAAVLVELVTVATKEAKSSGQFVVPGLGKAVKASRRLEWVAILRPVRPSRFQLRRW